MPKHVTTIRLDDALRKKVLRQAKKDGMTLSDVVQFLLAAFARGDLEIGVRQYSKAYLDTLHKEAEELRELNRAGKVKRYKTAKEAFDDILGR